MQIAGAIIAGGRGSRMGTPHKAALHLRDGSSPVQRLVAALQACRCGPVVIVANQADPYAEVGVRVIPDRRCGLGPLAGIEAALLALAPAAVCVVAGDMPGLGPTDLQRLIAAWDGRLAVAWTDRMQPLCAVVAPTLAGEVSQALDRGEHGVYRLWERLGAVPVRFPDERAFVDLDTPEDLARFQ
jgi:molybdopterin-guanine dinucleotide biosynthesis protein A